MLRSFRRIGGGTLALALSLSFIAPGYAVEEGNTAGSTSGIDTLQTASLDPPKSVLLERQRRQTLRELEAISSTASMTEEALANLDREIADLRSDREAIREAMIDAASRQKDASQKLTTLELRIADLSAGEGELKASLAERRGLLAEVLAALQRMGRKPPPALLVRPEDALGSVRSAILMGSVVPGLRDETKTLLADLRELERVRSELALEMNAFGDEMARYRSEEQRLKRLSERKTALEEENLERRDAAKQRANELAEEAGDLKGLIAALEDDVRIARQIEEAEAAAAEKARQDEARQTREREQAQADASKENAARLSEALVNAEAASQKQTVAQATDETRTDEDAPNSGLQTARGESAEPDGTEGTPSDVEAFPDGQEEFDLAMVDPGTAASPTSIAKPSYDIEALRRSVRFLEPSAPFSTMRGRLSPPIAGKRLVAFGDRDDIGRKATGVSFASRAGDVVTAPSDAKVLYSGPFRSYGEVLILDVGDTYHVVLAGMDRIDVETGQFVSSGEPIGAMGSRRIASANATDFGTEGPALYVEFRKNGRPVDPSAWWAD